MIRLQNTVIAICLLTAILPVRLQAEDRVEPTIDISSNRLQVDALDSISVDIYARSPLKEIPWLWATSLPRGAALRDSLEGYRIFEWTPEADQAGVYTIRLIAADAVESSRRSDTRITVIVNGDSDDAMTPQLLVPETVEVLAGNNVSFTVDAARPSGVIPGLTAANMPQDAVFGDNGNGTRQFSWQTDDADLGTHQVTFRAVDPYTLRTSLATVDIIVKSPSLTFVDVSALSVEDGFKLVSSSNPFDSLGQSVSAAGDVNGDGLADIVISAPGANRRDDGEGVASGAAYVVFGGPQAPAAVLDVAELDGVNGFAIEGGAVQLGDAVGSAGDINGDGIDDLIVGEAFSGSDTNAGRIHVIYGRSSVQGEVFPVVLNVGTLDGKIGFTLIGLGNYDALGIYMGEPGDINGDGLDDMVLASPQGWSGELAPGRGYIVYGRLDGFPASWSVEDIDGSNGFEIVGSFDGERLGSAISAIGDVNDDGVDDIVITRADTNLDASGSDATELRAFVLFGRNTLEEGDFPASFVLGEVDGSNGFAIGTSNTGLDQTGPMNVSGGADMNADGIDDLVLGEPWVHTEDGQYVGQIMVVYGRNTAVAGDFPDRVDAFSLTESSGFKIKGSENLMGLGTAISGLRDFNGDGIGDLVAKTTNSDRSYVLYGRAGEDNAELPARIADIDQTDGLVLLNVADTYGNNFSHRVSDAGDINGDGITDLIIGSPAGYPDSEEGGEAYLIYGSASARE